MPSRTEEEIEKDLKTYEQQLDAHLDHCETCDEDGESYCRVGEEISAMLTRLMMEKLRLEAQQKADARDAADAAVREKQHRSHG